MFDIFRVELTECILAMLQNYLESTDQLLHVWLVLFLLEPAAIFSPDLDLFDASGSIDSSSFFRAFNNPARKKMNE